MQRVAVVAQDGVLNFEVAVPGQVFGSANLAVGRRLYDVQVCRTHGDGAVPAAAEFGGPQIVASGDLAVVAGADVVVVPGDESAIRRSAAPPRPELLEALHVAADRGARLVSLCVGAFTLAAGGFLDGRRATTHWAYTDDLARRHPAVQVEANALYVDEGDVLTSAGVTASIDLCVHIVRSDHGDRAASAAARHLVTPPHRLGGQAQFVQRDALLGGSGSLAGTLRWLETNLDQPVSLADIADHAGLSERSVTRHFRTQTGASPLQWLLDARISRAKELLAQTEDTVEEVSRRCGFGSGASFRRHFSRVAGVAPRTYRRAFGSR